MSGGGDKGPYQAAVFKGLIENSPLEDVTYDVLVGVSAGALNSLVFSPFKPEQVHEAAKLGRDLWNDIPNHDAYGQWPGGIVQGMLFEKGVLNIQPGIDWVTEKLGGQPLNRKVTFSSTNADTGEYHPIDFNATGTQPKDFIMSAFASCIIPFAFGQVVLDGHSLLDGGCKWKLDVLSTVRRCKEVVDDEADIIVDLILTNNPTISVKEDVSEYTALEHFLRHIEMGNYYNTLDDYNSTIFLYPNVTFRYLISPSESIKSGLIPLNYNQEQIDRCFRVGEKDGKNAVKLGPGGYASVLFEMQERQRNGENPDFDEIIATRLKMMENDQNTATSE